MEYGTTRCKTALSPSRLPSLTYSLNPYFGCEHGCLYCYSRSIFRNEEIARGWGAFVKAKSNIVEVLKGELSRKTKGTIGLSTVTDPYQPAESKFELSRSCLKALSSSDLRVSIQTKSSLVLRDADLIVGPRFDVGVTITTVNPELARKLEPRASPPDERQQVLEDCSHRKVDTWIFLGPIIPCVNDDYENLEKIVCLAKRTNSRILFDKLNLRPWVLESLTSFLTKEAPEVVEDLPSLLSGKSDYWRTVSARTQSICRDKGVRCEPAFPIP